MDTSLELAQTSSPQTPSSPPPPIRYFDLLPPELLQDIIEHLAPREHNVGNYLERRKILRPLCLTSKRLLQITLPVLSRTLWLRTEPDWLGCEDITNLVICDLTLPPTFMLDCPSLEQLSLSYVEFSTETNLVHNVPALRHLAVSPHRRSDLQDRFVASLVPQLYTLSTRLIHLSHTHSLFQQFANVQILSSCDMALAADVTSSRATKIQHLQLTTGCKFGQVGGDQETLENQQLSDWLDLLVEDPEFNPDSIYLPSFCSPLNPDLLPSVRDAFESILTICAQLSINVIFESTYVYHVMDSPISVDFVKRTEEKRRLALETEKGDEA